MLLLLFHFVAGLDCSQQILFPQRLPSTSGAPRQMPPDLTAYYTRCGQIPIEAFYVDDSNKGAGLHYNYSQSSIDNMISTASKWKKSRKLSRPPDQWLFDALHHYPIRDRDVLVVGRRVD